MTVPVLTAVTGEAWEAALVTTLEHEVVGVTVVRRCLDIADLLAAAASGAARAVLLSAGLRRLDRDALTRLAAGGVAVVGLVTPGDADAERRLHQLGVRHVLAADATAAQIAAAVLAAVADISPGGAGARRSKPRPGGAPADGAPPAHPPTTAAVAAAAAERPGRAYADPRAALTAPVDESGPAAPAEGGDVASRAAPGRLVAVWGPTGAPGRTTLAVNLAAELALLGIPTLLADADVYGGAVAQVLGLLDEAPGLAAATRMANNAALDLPALAKVSPQLSPHLRVLTGIARADRWPELRPAALEPVYALARELAAVTVVDCGFCLEQDEELSFDTAAPRRNGATLTTLELADTVVAVGAADPVGVQRLVRGLSDLREAVPGAYVVVVLNRVRRGPVGADPQRQLAEALERYAGISQALFVPEDRAATDAALLHGRALAEVAPESPARSAIAAVARQVGAVPEPGTGARAGRRRPRRRVRARRPG